jgi:hypothetical protein
VRHTFDFLQCIPGIPAEVLNEEFPFWCVQCGYHPVILSADCCRKSSMWLKHGSFFTDPNHDATEVNLDEFHQDVLLRAFSHDSRPMNSSSLGGPQNCFFIVLPA